MALGTLFINLALATLFVSGVHAAIFTIKNNCPYTIWPGILTGQGSPASSTGFELSSQASTAVNIPAPWSGRVWARFVCSNVGGKFSCLSGDCGTGQIACSGAGAIPPATLVEFTIAAADGTDFYDVSLVDGFNLPVSVSPEGMPGCRSTDCPVDINAQCPQELSIKNTDGGTIGCKRACLVFKQPQFCCTGEYGSPSTCTPTSYSQFFKSRCPNAYSYAFDDGSSTFTCSAGADYLITFCP